MTTEECLVSAIATKFNGIEYRSRLEARWAAFMHNIGWEHTYEPFDGNGYIPDFIVHGSASLFIEVKPAVDQREFEAEVPKVDRGLSDYFRDALIVGATPFIKGRFGNAAHDAAGWLGEAQEANDGSFTRSWDAAEWFRCMECNTINVFHSLMSFNGRPCGHYDGDHHLGAAPIGFMEGQWADACNEVKWRGRAA